MKSFQADARAASPSTIRATRFCEPCHRLPQQHVRSVSLPERQRSEHSPATETARCPGCARGLAPWMGVSRMTAGEVSGPSRSSRSIRRVPNVKLESPSPSERGAELVRLFDSVPGQVGWPSPPFRSDHRSLRRPQQGCMYLPATLRVTVSEPAQRSSPRIRKAAPRAHPTRTPTPGSPFDKCSSAVSGTTLRAWARWLLPACCRTWQPSRPSDPIRRDPRA
jgi:hypothetical protein